jgi:uncharacterized protein
MTTLEEFRHEKDAFLKNDPDSPLTFEQKKVFKGLKYFSENSSLRLEVVVERFPKKEKIHMETSSGSVQTYTRYGRFKFTIDGQETELTIYGDHSDFFMPFVDNLHGKETYGGGRYLEPIELGKENFLIDFNMAYNPYCAYNDLFSCPLTPFENRVKVSIRAGEMIFHP